MGVSRNARGTPSWRPTPSNLPLFVDTNRGHHGHGRRLRDGRSSGTTATISAGRTGRHTAQGDYTAKGLCVTLRCRETGPIFAPEVSSSTVARLSNLVSICLHE